MTPLRLVVLGFVIVVADLPVGRIDLLLDPAGWAFVLLGCQQLVTPQPAFVLPRNAAVVGLIVSIPMVLISLGPLVDLVVETALQVAVFFTLCTALLRAAERQEARAVFAPARWCDLALNPAFLITLGVGLPGLAGVVALADIGVLAWAAYWMWAISTSPELAPR